GESDLGQSANPGSNCQAFLVTGKGLVQVGKELGPFRTRADQAHVAAQDIDELGQFIQMTEAQEPAQPRDARVSGKGPARAGRCFAIMDHGANLQDGEKSALAAYPSLLVKGRPRRGQLDKEGCQKEERSGQDQQGQSNQPIDSGLEKWVQGFA